MTFPHQWYSNRIQLYGILCFCYVVSPCSMNGSSEYHLQFQGDKIMERLLTPSKMQMKVTPQNRFPGFLVLSVPDIVVACSKILIFRGLSHVIFCCPNFWWLILFYCLFVCFLSFVLFKLLYISSDTPLPSQGFFP